jgi:hypothetical protein
MTNVSQPTNLVGATLVDSVGGQLSHLGAGPFVWRQQLTRRNTTKWTPQLDNNDDHQLVDTGQPTDAAASRAESPLMSHLRLSLHRGELWSLLAKTSLQRPGSSKRRQ